MISLTADQFKEHPALLVWELPDEALQRLPKEMEGRTLYRLDSEETHVVAERAFRDGIRGLGVHVYATSRAFEAK